MKKILTIDRDESIRRKYDELIKCSGINMDYVSRNDLIDLLSKSKAPQFYISPKMCEQYVIGYLKGREPVSRSNKRRMIEDLVKVFKDVRTEHSTKPMNQIWVMVVEHEAPSYYLTKQRIAEIIFNYHRNYERKQQNKSAYPGQ